MLTRTVCRFLLGGLLVVSFLALPACQSASKAQTAALTSKTTDEGAPQKYRLRHVRHWKGSRMRVVREPVEG